MKLVSTATLALALTIAAGSVFAADTPAKTLTPQQQKMKNCNAQAADKKGDERKAFMSTCLKGSSTAATAPAAAPAAAAAPAVAAAPAKPMTQQEKMKACNTQASDKKGADRKTFMSTCLKGNGSAAAAH